MTTVFDDAQRAIERAMAEGVAQGTAQAQQEFFGQSAIVLLSTLFSGAMSNASQMIRAHSVAASDFFAAEAARISEFGTPPQVTAITPQTDAASVPAETAVAMVFSTHLDPASVIDANIYLMPDSGGNHIGGVLAYDDTTLTVTFTPDSPLSYGVTYRVTATGAVTGRLGQPMTQTYVSTFTVEADPGV